VDKVPFNHCPSNKKNCVSTIDLTSYHRISPIPIEESSERVKEKIHVALAHFDQTEVKEETPKYIHAVFSTKFLKFKDDVEFYIDEYNHLLHIRSASRLGYYDFKANRKRIDRFKHLFHSL